MAARPGPRLRKIRARGSVILGELTRGSGAVAAERAWVGDLLLAVAPWGELEQSRYQPLNAFDDDEKDFVQEHLDEATVEDLDHFHAIQSHAVRMHRLEGLFKRIESATPAKPRGKGADHLSGGTTVEREQMLQRIAQARALLGEVIEGTDLPMIERTVKLADMNLHWAQWNLGEPVALMPEME